MTKPASFFSVRARLVRSLLLTLPLSLQTAALAACGSNVDQGAGGHGTAGAGGSGNAGGQGGTPGDLGKTFADAVCTKEAECGAVQFVCSDCGIGGSSGGWSASVTPVDENQCLAQDGAKIEAIVSCGAPTEMQQSALETCIQNALGMMCPTQADIDAAVAALNAGGEYTAFPTPYDGCAVLGELITQCNASKGCQESSSGTSSSGMSECDTTWSCTEGDYTASCSSSNGGDYTCTCAGPTGAGQSFTSTGCPTKQQANAGCGWAIP